MIHKRLFKLSLDQPQWVNDSFVEIPCQITDASSDTLPLTGWWQLPSGYLLPIWQYQVSTGQGRLLVQADDDLDELVKATKPITIEPAESPYNSQHPVHYIVTTEAGIGCALHLARQCRQQSIKPLFLAQHEGALPVAYQPSYIVVDGMPPGVTAAIILLEDWTIPSRLSCYHMRAGCYQGAVSELLAFCRIQRNQQARYIVSFSSFDVLNGCVLEQDQVSYYPVAQLSQLKEALLTCCD